MLKKLTFAVCLLLLVPAFIMATEVPKELDAYLALPDDSYRWEIVEKPQRPNDRTYVVELTSQTWQGITWKHYMMLAIPANITSRDHALLMIEGSNNGDKPGDIHKMGMNMVANQSGMCVALLLQVPNQPLLPNDKNPGGYVEDALIGETFLRAVETQDATWPLLFPMTKSAIRAMDAVQEILKQERKLDIEGFVVGGASKRGWTTWLTAASGDKRVVAVVPIVIDNLNTGKQMEYQLETWGEYSASINDYVERDLLRSDNTPRSEFEEKLWTMIDPYSYRSRLTMPKLLMHGANDPYWTVDATKWYFDDLPGVKFIRTVPNAGHGLGLEQGGNQAALIRAAMNLFSSVAVFAKHATQGGDWPILEWTLTESDAGYQIDIDTNLPLRETVRDGVQVSSGVKLWTATSETKDFRQARWTAADQKGSLSITVPKPQSGHIAFFVEIESRNEDEPPRPFSVTTQVWRF